MEEKKVEQNEEKKPTIAELIKTALLKDLDLTEEEYKAKRFEDDKVTAKHGIKGRAPITESMRHRRMAMNFYGTVLNILVNIHASNLEMLAEQKKTNRLLESMITAAVEEEQNE